MANEPVIHVVDDDEAVRDSLAFLLEAAGLAVRTYDSAARFLHALPNIAPGCIVTDIRMPEMGGLELVDRLNELGVGLPVIVITGHGDIPLAVEAMKAGVADFIEKPFDDEVMLTALRSALRRADEVGRRETDRAAVTERLNSLSAREQEVLDGLVAGHANKVIAYDLGISPRTVEVYRANVMTKMKAASLSDLVRMSLLAGKTV